MKEDAYVFVNLDNVAIIRESSLGYVVYFENKRVSILNNEEKYIIWDEPILYSDKMNFWNCIESIEVFDELEQVEGQLEIGDFI